MEFLKKYSRLSANSILESVIALSIIAICMYVAVLVYTRVFTSKTSPRFYNSRNKFNEIYYLVQLNPDTLEAVQYSDVKVERQWVNPNLQQIDIEYKDSSGVVLKHNFFVPN